jgi:hypothetical protein
VPQQVGQAHLQAVQVPPRADNRDHELRKWSLKK